MVDPEDADSSAAVLCTDLVRVYTAEGVEVQALQGLSLRVDPGELVAIVGHRLVGMSRTERVSYQRKAVGFIWQQTARNLLPYLTGAENIAIVLAVAGHPRRRARIDELLDLTDAADEANKLPAEMSGGQQQRVAIAVALANSPQVLLADEPTGELDEAATQVVLETMRSVNEQIGTTTLIVTHDASVSGHVRRTIQIRDGRIAAETLRRTVIDYSGEQRQVAEDFAVLDRVGRMQLPPEMVRTLDLRERVRLDQRADHVTVWPRSADEEYDR